MSVFPEFERALHEAAQRRVSREGRHLAAGRVRFRHIRGRSLLLATLVVFGTCAAIALAATGVILTGSPVRPQELPNPHAGIGVSAPGGASGIVATAPDPEGGLPWGLRIVHTTRGETCLQIGRVQNGKLGVLGIDGAFANDGRFHPIPVNALPRDVYHHTVFDQIGSATISCALEGKAVAGEHIGVDRSADPNSNVSHNPPGDLRDLLYGLLGSQAVSVTYHFERAGRTVNVAQTTGAYLIVHGFSPKEQAGYGDEALGTFGDLAPSPPLSLITYRIGGRSCDRGPSLPPGVVSHIAKPCPFPHFPQAAPEPALHLPLRARLATRGHTVSGLSISLIAPFAITSAQQHYTLTMLSRICGARHGGRGGGLQSIDRDVLRGERIGWQVPEPSSSGCDRHRLNVEVVYSPGEGLGRTIASATIHAPPGTSFAAPATPPKLRRAARSPRYHG